MSGFVKGALSLGAGLFGKKQSKSSAPNVDLNRNYSTQYSSLRGGNLRLDPSVRGLQEEALGGIRSLRDLIGGNAGAFIQARLNPLRRGLSERRGSLVNELNRTGVRGTFRNNALNNFTFDSERELADAEAMALADTIGAQRGLNLDIGAISSDRANQELKGLGLGSETISALLGRATESARLKDAGSERGLDFMPSILKGAGKIIDFF